MASVEELKSTVADANRAVGEGRKTLQKAGADAAEAEQRLARVVHDSRHEEVEKALDGLAEVRHEVELTLRRFVAAEEHASAYLAELG
jgi:ABC-type transporter Mla subunit MlaD